MVKRFSASNTVSSGFDAHISQNLLDICRLKWSQVDNNILIYTREKTENTKRVVESIIVPIKKQTREIIKKWGNEQKNPEDYIFPW